MDEKKNNNGGGKVVSFDAKKNGRQKAVSNNAEQVQKKPRGRNGAATASIEKNTTARPEEIAQAVRNAFQYFHRPIVKTDEECAERIDGYFKDCYEQQMIPTVENLSLALGTVRQVVWQWENGQGCSSARADMIKKAKQILASIDAELVSSGKIPQVVYIFRAKNFYQMSDQQEITINAQNGTEEKSVEDVRKWLEEGRVETEFADGGEGAEGAETGL